jgi:hypothetical protein
MSVVCGGLIEVSGLFGLVLFELSFFWEGVNAFSNLWSEFLVRVLQGLTPFCRLTPVLMLVFGWMTPTGVAAEIKI